MNEREWDVFISYAAEDLEAIAQPLASLLAGLGVVVWFDQTSLSLGDSLRAKIDEGLAKSRFGIVILSEAFFSKHYPVRELNGLAQCEVNGSQVILPVWHNVDAARVRSFSPPLADRVAAKTSDGLVAVASKVLSVIRSDILDDLVRKAGDIHELQEVRDGKALASLLSGAHAYLPHYDTPSDESDSELVASFLQECQDWGDIISEMETGDRVRAEFRLAEGLAELNRAGWHLYGCRQRRGILAGHKSDWQVAVLAVLRGAGRHVAVMGDTLISDTPS